MASSLNPILCEARLGRQLSEEGVRLARAALLPEVVAMGAGSIYSYQLNSSIPRWSIGVGIRIPLFDGLGKEYRYKAAKSELQSVEEYVENAQSEIMLLVEKEYYTFENTLSNIATAMQSIALAETYYYSANEGFLEGIVAASELMDACVEVAAAKVEYLNAVYENCLALARLLEASGLSGTFIKYMSDGVIVDI
jgi:outer membrane protein TolC